METEVGTGFGMVFHTEAVGEVTVGGFAEDVVETRGDVAEAGEGFL